MPMFVQVKTPTNLKRQIESKPKESIFSQFVAFGGILFRRRAPGICFPRSCFITQADAYFNLGAFGFDDGKRVGIFQRTEQFSDIVRFLNSFLLLLRFAFQVAVGRPFVSVTMYSRFYIQMQATNLEATTLRFRLATFVVAKFGYRHS